MSEDSARGEGGPAAIRGRIDTHELIDIPTDFPRATAPACTCLEHESAMLDPGLDARVAALGRDHGVAPSTVMLAAWATLAYRLSLQDTIAVLVVAEDSGADTLVHIDLSGPPTVAECLLRVSNAFADPDMEPAAQSCAGSASSQLRFAYGVDAGIAPTVARCELGLSISDGDRRAIRIDYDANLHAPATVAGYLRDLHNLLWAMVADDASPIHALAMLDDERRSQVLEGWNDARAEYPRTTCLHELVEAQVERSPDAIAVVSETGSLTFSELNSRANQLAWHLRSVGVGPDDRVAIFMERGWALVVGMLAILKSGGAYVPLDPTYPVERIAHMLSDSAPKALLLQSSLAPRIAGLHVSCPAFDPDSDAPAWSAQPMDNPKPGEVGLTSRHLAYVIYTSGSTGVPKGAMNEHRAVVNRLLWTHRTFALDAGDAILQKAPISFDASVREVFGALMSGAQLVMARPEGHKDPAYLAHLILEHGITTAHFVPSMLQAFLEDPDAAMCAPALRRVICGGEVLPMSLAQRFHRQMPGVELLNQYGPTETAITVTCWRCVADDARVRVPIGRPIANNRIYILDARGEPVPQGVVGELHIGGQQVGRGYLNREALTAERFLPDPFVGGDARMYRTGDLARWLPGGVIDFLGRNDFQVKIRGFRIELGEIEARLAAHPQVSAAVVLADDRGSDELRLVCWYVTHDPGTTLGVEQLRAHLAATLPDHMIPALYVKLVALPVTANGKLDRRALPQPGSTRPALAVAYAAPRDADELVACTAFAQVLGIDQVGRDDNFFDLGGSSLLALRMLERVRRTFARHDAQGNEVAVSTDALSPTAFFADPTPAGVIRAVFGSEAVGLESARMGRVADVEQPRNAPIAIVAMAGRMPGAADIEAFWDNLRAGRDTITHFDPGELDPSISEALRNDPAYVPARGVIDDLDQFDAAFFGINPREAEIMDPQQRVFLELCWECLERGGYAPDATTCPVGVFAGMNHSTYFQNHVSTRQDLIDRLGNFQVTLCSDKGFLATRVAHKLNLTGPAVSLHTACSTSLVAICQAMDSLRAGRCDMALAGAASATCPPRSGYRYEEGAMLSPDGHTRAFDRQASGTVFSDGAAVLLLKRLADAQADGDPIIALIRGGAINNDGGRKASFTAPSSAGQAAVVAMAHRDAGVRPRDISYVEAHGTATPLGDPIEIEGLTRAFRHGTADTGFCRIGSVKSNVGHLVIAAGAAGVIKTALAMRDHVLPPTVHFSEANPAIDFANSPFVVNASLSEWTSTDGAPLRAGVSSFGVGGTNAHVVMEEAPPRAASESAPGPHLLVLSARTPAALARAATRLGEHLQAQPDLELADVAWTLAAGRKEFAHRLALAVDDYDDATARLASTEVASAATRSRAVRSGGVVFMFPGQGSQYAGMGRALHAVEPAFRDAFDACAEGLRDELGFDLREIVFGDDPQALLPTSVMQPAIFAMEYALARLWMHHGVVPTAMVGHSIGEFVAATLAGVFSLADALVLVARRGRLMQAQPAGTMLSVRLPLDALQARLPDELSVAAENAPSACVVAGPGEAIASFQAQLEADGVACRALQTSHAFHSRMMDPVIARFEAEVAAVARNAPMLPVFSTAAADWLDAARATSPGYWSQHLRQPVRFSAALGTLIDPACNVLLEVGTRTTLAGLARQQPALQQYQVGAVSSLADSPDGELKAFRQAAGQLWARGVAFDPTRFDLRGARRRVRLPTYPFERQRFWVDAVAQPDAGSSLQPPPASVNAGPERPELHLVASLAEVRAAGSGGGRRPQLVSRVRELFEDAAGFPLEDADANFIELGLDSLLLTQVAPRLYKTFGVRVTFRQLMGECATLHQLAEKLDSEMPQDATSTGMPPPAIPTASETPQPELTAAAPREAPLLQLLAQQLAVTQRQLDALVGDASDAGRALMRDIVARQQQLMDRQLALLADVGMPAADLDDRTTSGAAIDVDGSDAGQGAGTTRDDVRSMDARSPLVPGARLGRDPQGRPGWYLADPAQPGQYLKVGA